MFARVLEPPAGHFISRRPPDHRTRKTRVAVSKTAVKSLGEVVAVSLRKESELKNGTSTFNMTVSSASESTARKDQMKGFNAEGTVRE